MGTIIMLIIMAEVTEMKVEMRQNVANLMQLTRDVNTHELLNISIEKRRFIAHTMLHQHLRALANT